MLNKTSNGQITFCPHHNNYHLEFGNMFLHLSHNELQELCEYVKSVDYQHYFHRNHNSSNIRKLLLNIGSNNIHFALNLNEFIELRNLLLLQPNKEIIQNKEIINLNVTLN